MWGRSMGKQLNLYGNPGVLNTLRCTQWYPRCTEHPLVYLTDITQDENALNTEYLRDKINHDKVVKSSYSTAEQHQVLFRDFKTN